MTETKKPGKAAGVHASVPRLSAKSSDEEARLCLAMIVKNEARILRRALEAAAPWIAAWAIVDTGSTDGTQALIRSFFEEKKIPGALAHVPFENFSQARNAALDHAADLADTNAVDFTHVLLCDADMELVVPPGSDPRIGLGGAPAHYVKQRDTVLVYDNTRLLRRDVLRATRYVGATHEYIAGAAIGQSAHVPPSHFHYYDHAEGSSRAEKFSRDLRLLYGDLVKNPDDGRTLFYLAQTYEGLGRIEDATRLYEARIRAGGSIEEVWMSAYRIGKLALASGDIERAETLLRKAHRMRPKRAEPLHVLANMYRLRGENADALLYAVRGQTIPFPDDDLLFVESYPYRWGFLEEIAISGFYGSPSDRTRGLRACQALSRDPEAPAPTRTLARSNLAHYARPLMELLGPELTRLAKLGAPASSAAAVRLEVAPWEEHYAHDAPTVPRLTASTPSIAWIPETRLASTVRWKNYRFLPSPAGGEYRSNDADGVVRSETDVVILDPERLQILQRKPVREACVIKRTNFRVQGFEDLRLFAAIGMTFATATVRDHSPDGRAEIALLTLHETSDAWEIVECQVLPGAHPNGYEKNWMPVLSSGQLPKLLAHVDPPTALSFSAFGSSPRKKGLQVKEWTELPALGVALDDARGGGQIVALPLTADGQILVRSKGSFLGIVHRAQTAGNGTRSYTHAFVGFDDRLRAISESPPFFFQHAGLEFAGGLVVSGAELLVSYHVRDCEAWIQRMPLAAVLSLLQPLSSSASSDL